MTLVLDSTDDPLLSATPHPALRMRVNAGRSVPAAALADRALAEWVRSHGVSVTARDDHDLDLIRYHGIRPVQVVFRCGPTTAPTRRAVAFDVSRFIVDTAQQMARVAECAHSTKYVYLNDQAPLMLGDKRLKVVGLHTEIVDAGDVDVWASSAQRLVSRAAVLHACGSSVKRLVLSGGSTQLWACPQQVNSIVEAVDVAVSDGCRQWNLATPAVTLAALTVAPSSDGRRSVPV